MFLLSGSLGSHSLQGLDRDGLSRLYWMAPVVVITGDVSVQRVADLDGFTESLKLEETHNGHHIPLPAPRRTT